VVTAALSERVVIVPPQQRASGAHHGDVINVATVRGLAPPPDPVAQQRGSIPHAAPVLTVSSELLSFARARPQVIVLAVVAGLAFLTLLVLVVVVVYVLQGSASTKVETTPALTTQPTGVAHEPIPSMTATAVQESPELPPPRTPLPPSRPRRR
jgi:Ca2+/Na+ antiporter